MHLPLVTRVLPVPDPRTLSAWFKTSTAGKPIFLFTDRVQWYLFKVSLNGSGALVVDLGGATITAGRQDLRMELAPSSCMLLPDNGNSGQVKVYVDGTATSGSGTTTINTSGSNDLKIGFDGANYFLDNLTISGSTMLSLMPLRLPRYMVEVPVILIV